ncbi:MAG: chromate transporter [Acholeplasmataceae bacterium]
MPILIVLVLMFLKVGFLGFGGGYAMLPLIFEEARNIGLTIEQFADLNVLDVLIPGPIAINAATYVGFLFGGIIGSTVATLTVTIPSFVFAPVLIKYEDKIKQNVYLSNVLSSVKAAAVGLIAGIGVLILVHNALEIDNLRQIFSAKINWFLLAVTFIGWFLHDKYKINPIILTIFAGIVGYLFHYI